MKNTINTLSKILLCLMLSLALIVPVAAPAEVLAATDSGTTQAAAMADDSAAAEQYTTSKNQTISCINIRFKKAVISNKRLPEAPAYLKVTGKMTRVKLSWTGVPASSISGYYILRRDINGSTWRQIATVKRTATTYTDKTANRRNTFYRYSLVAYKKVNGKIMVSTAAGWAGALTTLSSKKNVNKISVTNIANVTSIMKGSCAQTYLSFPDKAYSRYIRWSSSKPRVATVDAQGLVRGVRTGTAVISMRTHSGRIYTFKVRVTKPGTAKAMIDTFYAWSGYSRFNGKHKSIIDIYNSVTPWPVGYKVSYTDPWCDATISAAAIKTGNVERIGRECGVPRHIDIFKKLGIWEEDGTITPKPGDIIVYSWYRAKQPNNSSASHIGLVVSVDGNEITCIEGNKGLGSVDTRVIPVGWGFIRGYARPNYAK